MLIFLLAFVAFGIFVGYTKYLVYEELKPPEGLDTLEELRSHLPPATDIDTVENKGDTYTLWWADTPSGGVLLLPSGKPLYVFDSEDKLVAWTTQTGDGGEIDNYAYAKRRAPKP